MESLRATPLVAIELLLGKTLPYLLVASAAAAVSLLLAWGLFDVPVRGSIVWLAVVTVLFLSGGLGWGMFISTLADTQQVAFQLGLLSSMLPTLLLSGFVFPISSMPAALQLISHIVPARYFIAALREIVLKGVGPEVWWNDALALVVVRRAGAAAGHGAHGAEPVSWRVRPAGRRTAEGVVRRRRAHLDQHRPQGAVAAPARSEDPADPVHRAGDPADDPRLRRHHRRASGRARGV